MKRKLTLISLLAFLPSTSFADTWSPQITISALEPLVEFSGGIVRVHPSSGTNPAGCSSASYLDFTFDAGTEETRSATISALYTAFAAGKKVNFYIDGDQCSPANLPIIRGVKIHN